KFPADIEKAGVSRYNRNWFIPARALFAPPFWRKTMFEFIKKALSGSNEAEIKRLRKTVEQINALEGQMQKLSDEEMRAYTGKLRERAKGGEALDKLLPEAYALVREAAVRSLGQRPFDTQMIGAIVLHQGRIAEMRTGEGKTLTAALPAFLNALPGEGV